MHIVQCLGVQEVSSLWNENIMRERYLNGLWIVLAPELFIPKDSTKYVSEKSRRVPIGAENARTD